MSLGRSWTHWDCEAHRMTDRGWGRPFEDPIKVDGRKLVTLRDAGEYIAAFPKREHDAPNGTPRWRR